MDKIASIVDGAGWAEAAFDAEELVEVEFDNGEVFLVSREDWLFPVNDDVHISVHGPMIPGKKTPWKMFAR